MRFIAILLILSLYGISSAAGTWKAEYAQNSPEVRDWYETRELTEATKERLGVAWKSCCAHSDVVKTQFRVEKDNNYRDVWFYLKDGEWTRIPEDIVHWDEHAPSGEPTLFVYQSTGQELCFFPPGGGL